MIILSSLKKEIYTIHILYLYTDSVHQYISKINIKKKHYYGVYLSLSIKKNTDSNFTHALMIKKFSYD